MKTNNYNLFVLVIIFLSVKLNAQPDKKSLNNTWKNSMIADSLRANAYNNLIVYHYQNHNPDSAYIKGQELLDFAKKTNIIYSQADAHLIIGNSQFILGNRTKALEHYNDALQLYKSINDKSGIAITLTSIGKLYLKNFKFDQAIKYHEESIEINKSIKDTFNIISDLINIGNVYKSKFKTEQSITYYNEGLVLARKLDFLDLQSIILSNLGDIYSKQKKFKEALNLFSESLKISQDTNIKYDEMRILFFIGSCYLEQKKYETAVTYGEKSIKIAKILGTEEYIMANHRLLFDAFKANNNFKKAMTNLEASISLERTMKKFNASMELQQLEIKNVRMRDSIVQAEKAIQTAILHDTEIQQKNREKTTLKLASGGILFIISLVGFLVYKNTKRKQQIAEQEKEIETQKKDKILKELELTAIDAMIEGQEKERQQLASDLHDSVGASLSAARLQFEHLANNKENIEHLDELIKKTSTLLEDAYVEVRSMAHKKNNGVMAKNGLLPAIERLSKNVSSPNGLHLDIHSHGLNQRLENTLEISIFRIIQELVTNIIKHAQATEAFISITQHEDSINLMVEDNGKGFDAKQAYKKEGMGLSSIEKRIELLEGHIKVDSTPKKGTTTIIDIPT